MSRNTPARPQEPAGEIPVLEIQKNASQRLRICHKVFKGRPYVDLRLWVADRNGDFVPTPTGISLRPEHLAQIIQALTIAGRELDQGGRHAN